MLVVDSEHDLVERVVEDVLVDQSEVKGLRAPNSGVPVAPLIALVRE
jgi:hypothetical protein